MYWECLQALPVSERKVSRVNTVIKGRWELRTHDILWNLLQFGKRCLKSGYSEGNIHTQFFGHIPFISIFFIIKKDKIIAAFGNPKQVNIYVYFEKQVQCSKNIIFFAHKCVDG